MNLIVQNFNQVLAIFASEFFKRVIFPWNHHYRNIWQQCNIFRQTDDKSLFLQLLWKNFCENNLKLKLISRNITAKPWSNSILLSLLGKKSWKQHTDLFSTICVHFTEIFRENGHRKFLQFQRAEFNTLKISCMWFHENFFHISSLDHSVVWMEITQI